MRCYALLVLLLLFPALANAQQSPEDVLRPYDGPSHAEVDRTTLHGKVMTGYQGWFNTPEDGAGLGWTHWTRDRGRPPGPGNVTIDIWPDLTELAAEERYSTRFALPDGQAAEVFSSHNRDTVVRHFQWMQEYGIDGAFVQRFANGLDEGKLRYHKDVVLAHCREGANRHGRTYAVMYDLSGLRRGQVGRVAEDWKMLRGQMEITADPAYQHHGGKPVVAVWGVGFSDDRRYSLRECHDLVRFLKEDGCTVMLGLPTHWRTGQADATDDPLLHETIRLADIVSPWTIGRYRSPREVSRHRRNFLEPDLAWCEEHKLEYLPVVFPGFSWHNLKQAAPLGQIPRLKGEFLWSQFVAAKQAGCEMIYVAMFDEVDEATAIFKLSDNPPIGPEANFLDLEGLPSDHYLWLTGQGGKLLRGEREAGTEMPKREQ